MRTVPGPRIAALALLLLPCLPAAAFDDVVFPNFLKRDPYKQNLKDDELQKLLKERFNSALTGAQARYQEYLAGRGTIDVLSDSLKTMLNAQLELTEGKEQLKVREAFAEAAEDIEKITKARRDAGRVTLADYEQTRVFMLDAKIALVKARRKAEAAKKKQP